MNPAEKIHTRWIGQRRIRVLARHIDKLLPRQGTLLDVGCGDGDLTRRLGARKPGLLISGLDVLPRPGSRIPVELFDGREIPKPDAAFDTVLLVDVLHHCEEPETLLSEAARVARQQVVVKDHLLEGWLAESTLRLMDRVGNARHGVNLPFRYWNEARWRESWDALDLRLDSFQVDLRLYPPPLGLVFDRGLHFIASLGRG